MTKTPQIPALPGMTPLGIKPRDIDCKDINTRLIEIVKEANWCRDRLANGDTGTGFDLSLKVMLLHINTIRAQIDTVRA